MVQTWSRWQAASTPGRARFRPPVAVSGRAAQSGYALGQGLVEPQAARVIDNLVGAFLDRDRLEQVVVDKHDQQFALGERGIEVDQRGAGDRKSVGAGKSGSVRVEPGGRR